MYLSNTTTNHYSDLPMKKMNKNNNINRYKEFELNKKDLVEKKQLNDQLKKISRIKEAQYTASTIQNIDTYLQKFNKVLERIKEINKQIVQEALSLKQSDLVLTKDQENSVIENFSKIIHSIEFFKYDFPMLKEDIAELESLIDQYQTNNTFSSKEIVMAKLDETITRMRNDLTHYLQEMETIPTAGDKMNEEVAISLVHQIKEASNQLINANKIGSDKVLQLLS